MVFKVYVITREVNEEYNKHILYYSADEVGVTWVNSCMFEEIKFYTKKKLAEEVLNSIKGNDTTMMVRVISLEMV